MKASLPWRAGAFGLLLLSACNDILGIGPPTVTTGSGGASSSSSPSSSSSSSQSGVGGGGGAAHCTRGSDCDSGYCHAGACAAWATAIAAGEAHTCAIRTDQKLVCWGNNDKGQIGNGSSQNNFYKPKDVGGLNGVSLVAAGTLSTCAIAGGAVSCWGDNSVGELGNGQMVQSSSPVPVNLSALDIANGVGTACAVTNGNGADCWGYNNYGQLGHGGNSNSSVPVPVTGLSSGVLSVAAGELHACALTMAGGIECWGSNTMGQLGDETLSTRGTAAPVHDIGGASAISCGWSHTCAIAGGSAWCWGSNVSGQLGTDAGLVDAGGPAADKPLVVKDLGADVSAISAGDAHTCAIAGGAVRCWGDNTYGQLGNGQKTGGGQVVDVLGLPPAIAAIATGGAHTCALTTSGGVRCWGRNDYGQLGDNTSTERLTPVNVVEDD